MSLVVMQALGLVTVQAAPRTWTTHVGLAPGGALVPGAQRTANYALGNRADAAVIEVLGKLVVRADAAIEIATDTTSPRILAPGETVTLESEPRRAAYLAISGGVAAPVMFGSASTHLAAELGAPLRAGAALASGQAPLGERVAVPAPIAAIAPIAIRVVSGPDPRAFAADAIAALVSAPYKLSPTSDRVGSRLRGPTLDRRDVPERSRPLVLGALEVPRDGQPIVLGPEHPTIGGYPIVAVICHADLDRFFAIRLGGSVQFVVGGR